MRIDLFERRFSPCSHLQKAVEENKVAREKQAAVERKQQEKESFTKRKQGKPVHLEDRHEEVDFRRELKERSQAINVASLEERLGSKSTAKPSPQQQDFRHILRPSQPADHTNFDSRNKPNGKEAVGNIEWQRSHLRRVHEGPPSPAGGGGGRFHQNRQVVPPGGQSGYSHHPHGEDPEEEELGSEEFDDRYDFETQF